MNNDVLQESGLPNDVDASAALCCMALSNPATQPIIVIVDALDQVSQLFIHVNPGLTVEFFCYDKPAETMKALSLSNPGLIS